MSQVPDGYRPEEIVDQPIPLVNGEWTDPTGSASGGEGITPQKIPNVSIPRGIVATEVISQSLDTQSRSIKGNYTFEQMGSIQIGTTTNGVKISPDGILGTHLGIPVFTIDSDGGNATFLGEVKAGSVVTGYLVVGSAAGDVNGGSTTINGGKITTGSITASQIQANTITANEMSINKLSAMSGNLGDITSGTITGGTINGGTINGATINLPNESLGTGSAGKLRWASNARMWGDSSGNIGINAVGGTIIFYTDGTERFQTNTTGMNVSQAITCKGLFLNQGQTEGDVRKVDRIYGYNDLRFGTGDGGFHDDYKFLRDDNNTNAVRIEHDTGKIHSFSSTIDLGGTDKTAIVPTAKGYKALYSMESPEVWFMDFCRGERKFSFHNSWKPWKWGIDWVAHPDSMFLEVTVPGYIITPTLIKGIVQVWGHRKGHEGKRFEEKTEDEFKKNEEFLGMAKVK